MRLISWNVNGLRAVDSKGFRDIFSNLDADIVCLQETKLQAGQIDMQFDGYTSYWNYADKKGYSGTAVFSRIPVINVSYGIGIDEHDHEGRVITIETEQTYIVCVYTPNSQDGLKRLAYRQQWDADFCNYVTGLTGSKPVLICGDLNVAHQEIDLKNPKTNHFNPGFTDEERDGFSTLLSKGFTDSFRHLFPDTTGVYSWWSYRFHAREKNIGWRIDYWLVSNDARDSIVSASIRNDIFGSDHCPVQLEIAQ